MNKPPVELLDGALNAEAGNVEAGNVNALNIEVVSLFPELVEAVAQVGMPSQAVRKGLLNLRCWNPREYTEDRHRTVDDRPYGGGPGMVMLYEPLKAAINDARSAQRAALPETAQTRTIYLSPQGKRLDQSNARRLAELDGLVLVCGRYEAIDQRLIESQIDEEWSIGDYVLSGGELAAMVMIDVLVRLVPGVLGHHLSAEQDSFSDGLLDCPHYTRPELVDGLEVPAVLMGGNHQAIARWRLQQSLGQTWKRRPDLLQERSLNNDEQDLLKEFIADSADLTDETIG